MGRVRCGSCPASRSRWQCASCMSLGMSRSRAPAESFVLPGVDGRSRVLPPRAAGRYGYHRGTPAAGLPPHARLLAAADAYHAMTESRPHRDALSPEAAAAELRDQARAGRLDPDSVAAVLEAAGHPPGTISRPGGLTAREAEVLTLLARGLATKQLGRTLGVTTKTADHFVQQVYAKIGVSTRAAAAVYAMQHGLATWENSR